MKIQFSRLARRFALAVVMLAPRAMFAAESPKPAPPQIDPKAQELLKQVCATLAAAKNFELHAEVTFDQVLPTRAKLQFAGAMDMARALPNRLMVNFASDLGSKRFWYDGKTVTLLDGAHKVYGTMAVESSIAGMLTEIADRGFTVPLSDLALSDPCNLLQTVKNGIYAGIGDVDGTPTDHLAFAGKGVTLQIWLERGARPLPRKIVITHTSIPESPQFTAVITEWRFPKEIPESMFTPEIPKGFIRADFAAAKKAIEPGNPGGEKIK